MELKRQLAFNFQNADLPPKPQSKLSQEFKQSEFINLIEESKTPILKQKQKVKSQKQKGYKRQSTINVDRDLDKLKFAITTLQACKNFKSEYSASTPNQRSEAEQKIINVRNASVSFQSALFSESSQSPPTKKSQTLTSIFSSSTEQQQSKKAQPNQGLTKGANKENQSKKLKELLGDDDIQLMNEISQKAYELSLKYDHLQQSQILKEKEKLTNLLKQETEINKNFYKQFKQEAIIIRDVIQNPNSPYRKKKEQIPKEMDNSRQKENRVGITRAQKLYEDASKLKNKIDHKRQESLQLDKSLNIRDQPEINYKSKQMINSNQVYQEPLYLRSSRLIHSKEKKLQKQRQEKENKENSEIKQFEQIRSKKGSMTDRQLQDMIKHHELWEQSRNYKRYRNEQSVQSVRDRELTFRPLINSQSKNVNQSFEQRNFFHQDKKEKRLKQIKSVFDSNLTFKPQTNLPPKPQKSHRPITKPSVSPLPKKPLKVCDMSLSINKDIYSIVSKYVTKSKPL